MIIAFALAAAAPAEMPNIDLPYQMIPAFSAYTDCVSENLRADPRFVRGEASELRDANAAALVACAPVRAQQLARALKLVTDHRPYGSRSKAHAAVRRAFDRFDSDLVVEPATATGKN